MIIEGGRRTKSTKPLVCKSLIILGPLTTLVLCFFYLFSSPVVCGNFENSDIAEKINYLQRTKSKIQKVISLQHLNSRRLHGLLDIKMHWTSLKKKKKKNVLNLNIIYQSIFLKFQLFQ